MPNLQEVVVTLMARAGISVSMYTRNKRHHHFPSAGRGGGDRLLVVPRSSKSLFCSFFPILSDWGISMHASRHCARVDS